MEKINVKDEVTTHTGIEIKDAYMLHWNMLCIELNDDKVAYIQISDDVMNIFPINIRGYLYKYNLLDINLIKKIIRSSKLKQLKTI